MHMKTQMYIFFLTALFFNYNTGLCSEQNHTFIFNITLQPYEPSKADPFYVPNQCPPIETLWDIFNIKSSKERCYVHAFYDEDQKVFNKKKESIDWTKTIPGDIKRAILKLYSGDSRMKKWIQRNNNKLQKHQLYFPSQIPLSLLVNESGIIKKSTEFFIENEIENDNKNNIKIIATIDNTNVILKKQARTIMQKKVILIASYIIIALGISYIIYLQLWTKHAIKLP